MITMSTTQTQQEPLTAAESLMCGKFVTEFRKRCQELDSTAQVTSRIMVTPTGSEYQVEVYEGGKPSGLYRIFRNLANGKMTFTRVYT